MLLLPPCDTARAALAQVQCARGTHRAWTARRWITDATLEAGPTVCPEPQMVPIPTISYF